jgi:hypothetical protein
MLASRGRRPPRRDRPKPLRCRQRDELAVFGTHDQQCVSVLLTIFRFLSHVEYMVDAGVLAHQQLGACLENH